jgi:toxin ParE1/3/4
MKIVRYPEVLEELINIAYYIAQDNFEAADHFLEACEETFQQLAQIPFIGSVREFQNQRLKDVRMWRVKGFEKHLIFYRPIQDGIEILHVVHAARDLEALFAEVED